MFRNLQRFQAKPIFLASTPLSRSFSSSLICNAKKSIKKGGSVKKSASAPSSLKKEVAPKPAKAAVEGSKKSSFIEATKSKKILTTAFNIQQIVSEVHHLSQSAQSLFKYLKSRVRNMQHPKDLEDLDHEKDQVSVIIETVGTYLQDKNLLKIQLRTERASELPFDELSQVLFQINAMRVHDYIAAQLFYLQSLAADFEHVALICYQKVLESQIETLSTKKKNEADPRKKVTIAKEMEQYKKALEEVKQEKKSALENVIQQQRQIIELEEQLIGQKLSVVNSIRDEVAEHLEEGATIGDEVEQLNMLQKIALVEFDAYDPCSQFGLDMIDHKNMLGFNLLAAGEHEESAKLFEQVLEVPVPTGKDVDPNVYIKAMNRKSMAYINCGSAYLLQKRLAEAYDRVTRGLKIAQEHGFKNLEAQAMRVLPAIEKLLNQAKSEPKQVAKEEQEAALPPIPPQPKTAAERAEINKKMFAKMAADSAANRPKNPTPMSPEAVEQLQKSAKKIVKKKKSTKKE